MDAEPAEPDVEPAAVRDEEPESRIILATLSRIAAEARVRDREAYGAATRRDRAVEPRAA